MKPTTDIFIHTHNQKLYEKSLMASGPNSDGEEVTLPVSHHSIIIFPVRTARWVVYQFNK